MKSIRTVICMAVILAVIGIAATGSALACTPTYTCIHTSNPHPQVNQVFDITGKVATTPNNVGIPNVPVVVTYKDPVGNGTLNTYVTNSNGYYTSGVHSVCGSVPGNYTFTAHYAGNATTAPSQDSITIQIG
jgi:hypothetical protein